MMTVKHCYKLRNALICILMTVFIVFFLSSYAHARPFGGQLSSQVSNAIKKQVKAAIVPTLTTKKNKIEYPQIMRFSKDKRYLAMTMEGAYISVWDMEKGKEIDNFSLESMKLKDFFIDYNRKEIYLIDDSGLIYSKPLVAGEAFKRIKKLQKGHRYHFVRVSAELIVLSTIKNEILVFEKNKQHKLLSRVKLKSAINSLDVADKSNQILVSSADKKLSLYRFSKKTNKLSLSQSWVMKNTINRAFFNRKGTALALYFKNGRYAYANQNKQKFEAIKLANKPALLIDFSDEQLNILTKEGSVVKQNVKTGKILNNNKVTILNTDLNSNLFQFYKKGQYLISPKRQSGLLLVDVNQNKKIAQLVSTKSGWAVLDKKGRYDGNEDAFHDVSWDAEGKLIDLDQFSEKYFEPGLLEKILTKKQKMITKPEVEIEKGIYLPPLVTVKILTNEKKFRLPGKIKLTVKATVDGSPDAMREIKIFHNGKKVPESNIILTKSAQDGRYGIKEWALKVVPVKGLNGFNVEVKGWENVSGQSQQVIFNAKQDVRPKPKRMFMKSIGIDEYKGKDLALDFAVADAKDIFKTFSSSALAFSSDKNKKQGARVNTLMLNQQASKKAILSLFDRTKRVANKNDMLVVFMSGHGIVIDNQWYFLPQEAKIQNDPKHLKSVGLSANELMHKFVDIPSQKIVLIIDACQSGAVTDVFNNFHQRRALRGLSKNTGIHIIAATRADQLAPEFGELGHGLFTYTLLNGMKKNSQGFYNADQWPKDGKLMVSELQQYAEKFVPALAHAMASRNYASSSERGGLDEKLIVTPVGSSQGHDFEIYQ